MTDGKTQSRGFSLVEILIAFFVLLVGVLAVLVLFPLGLRESGSMENASTASFAARNARNLMEVHPFTYEGNKQGNGTATMVQILFGPRGTRGNIIMGTFPVMFPADVLGENEDNTFPKSQRPVDPDTTTRDRVIDYTNPQFSWDARFTVGGGLGLTPPPGGFDMDDVQYWHVQYFKYYAVQFSVYRNYETIPIGSGVIWVRTAKKSGGDDYDANDPNRPLYSELELTTQPDADLTVGSAIRVRDDKSDWYRITSVEYESSPEKWIFRLDRPYTGLVDAVRNGNLAEHSWARTDIIGTNTLIESFTTILGSQLDETDTTNVDTIEWP